MNNAMAIFKHLPRTNCRECLVPTCLAFAVAVFKGDRRLGECPYVDPAVVERFEGRSSNRTELQQEHEKLIEPLRRKISAVDFSSSAERLGAALSGGYLVIKVLGKDFTVHPDGSIVSDIHVHAYVTVPLLDYVVSCAGKTPTGEWVPFRELTDGVSWGPLFADQFERPLKSIADAHPELFENMIRIFGGKPVPSPVGADVSIALHPLPKVPMLICWWKPEEGIESTLGVFVDRTAEENISIESIFTLGVGLVRMFERVAAGHGR
jgi:hypothetical protein